MRYRTSAMVGILIVATLFVYAATFTQHRFASAAPDEEQQIRDATNKYVGAFNKAEVDGLVALWGDDGEYVDAGSKCIKGRAALRASFKAAFDANRGVKLEIKTGAIRLVNHDVAIHDGTATLTRPNGESESCSFSAVWVKRDGAWLLNLVREIPRPDGTGKSAGGSQLKDLAWLVGEWKHVDKERTTSIAGCWMKGKQFLALEYAVRDKEEEVLALTQIIGWDPTGERLHSWVFDSRGGFGEGVWNRDGNTWTAETAGVTSGGLHGSGTIKFSFVNDDTFVFQGLDRNVDGQPLPDVKIIYQRVKGAGVSGETHR